MSSENTGAIHPSIGTYSRMGGGMMVLELNHRNRKDFPKKSAIYLKTRKAGMTAGEKNKRKGFVWVECGKKYII